MAEMGSGDDAGTPTDDDALIPLKRSVRDVETMRSVLRDWLGPRVAPGSTIELSPITLPEGTGVANETVMFDATWTRHGTDHTEGFVARIASDDPLYYEADIEIHHDMYAALADVEGVPVPRVYGYEPDAGLLGAPFFVMGRIEGQVPGDNPHWNTSGFVVDASPDDRRRMWENAVDALAALHQVDASRLAFLKPPAGVSGFEDHLAYWRRYLSAAAGPSTHDTLEAGYEWLTAHLPDQAPTGISWGDSRFANIMFRGVEVVALFDWDTVSLAGAGADLAWWRFMDGPSAALVPGIGGPDELVVRWQERTGVELIDLAYYDVFTTFRLGCILMRLYGQLGANGTIPADVAAEQGRNSGPAQALAAQLAELS